MTLRCQHMTESKYMERNKMKFTSLRYYTIFQYNIEEINTKCKVNTSVHAWLSQLRTLFVLRSNLQSTINIRMALIEARLLLCKKIALNHMKNN